MLKLLSFNFSSQGKIIAFFAIAILLTAAIVLFAVLLTKKKVRYSVKASYLTPTERRYYNLIRQAADNRYYVYPQINLAAVINKDTPGYRSELFRNADFGLFDKNFHPVLLIEINDDTHLKADRKQRDKSVNKICKSAKLPLVTFWTRDADSDEKIIRTIRKYL